MPITIVLARVLVLDSRFMMTVIHDHSSATCQKKIGKEERTRIQLRGPPACVGATSPKSSTVTVHNFRRVGLRGNDYGIDCI